MTDRHGLIAFMATLFSILYLVTVAAVLAANQQYSEAIGVGAAVTGLIGLAGTFKPKSNPVNQLSDETLNTAVNKIPPATGEASEGGK